MFHNFSAHHGDPAKHAHTENVRLGDGVQQTRKRASPSRMAPTRRTQVHRRDIRVFMGERAGGHCCRAVRDVCADGVLVDGGEGYFTENICSMNFEFRFSRVSR